MQVQIFTASFSKTFSAFSPSSTEPGYWKWDKKNTKVMILLHALQIMIVPSPLDQ
jgi:hypothetical protein